MDVNKRVQVVRDQAFVRISKAISVKDARSIIRYSDIVKQVENVEKDINQALSVLTRLERNLGDGEFPAGATNDAPIMRDNRYPPEIKLSPRAHSRVRRQEYLEGLMSQGIKLIRTGEKTFQSGEGGIIAIPHATERSPNKWWLGQAKAEYAVIILLCERDSGELVDLVLDDSLSSD